LVSKATYNVPQRVINGYDQKRLAVILAVLEKKAGIFLGDQDVFVKISGAMKVTDPSLDITIATSIWSSFLGKPVKKELVSFGELALTGNIQKAQLSEDRKKMYKS
jgi:DNA repair protein RadA/Sms